MSKVYLFIDTSQSTPCCLKLLDENFNQLAEHLFLTQNNLIDYINPELNNLFEKANKTFNDVARIYLNYGPGTFTGIRVGVSVAKTFKMVYPNITIYLINSLKLKCFGDGVAYIDAKSHKYFFAAYRKGVEVQAPKLILDSELDNYLKQYSNLPIYSDDQIFNYDFPKEVFNLFEECLDVANLEPFYLKAPI